MRYLILILLAGCTMNADPTASFEFNKCVDTRDGETFTLVGSTVRNGRYGIGTPSCVDIDDTTGRKHTLCGGNVWLKCEIN